MPADLTPLEEDLLAALDRRELARYREVLGTAPPEAGDDGERDRAGEYVRGKLRAWGIPATTHRFEALVGVPGEARFTLARRDAPVAAIVHPYSAATPPGGIVAELRPAAPDRPGDLAGAIALVEGEPEGAAVAEIAARGAVGQVYISPDEALRPVAVPGDWGGAAPTPVIGIGRSAGEGFLALCTAGATAVRLAASVTWQPRRAQFAVATIAGADEPRDYLLVGAATPPAPGANGDAAACLLELCRVAALHAGRLRRGVRCIWWPGGVAPAAGPLWYADQAWEELGQHAWGYVALHDAARLPGLAGWPEVHLRHFAEAALRDGDLAHPRWAAAPPFAAALPFARLGLPTLALGTRPEDLPTLLPVIARLCTVPLLPLDATALARAVQERIGATLDALGDRLELGPLRARAAALYAATERLQIALLHLAQADSTNDEEGIAIANRLIHRLQRLLLPALRHPGDPFAARPSVSDAPLPGLAPALAYAASPEPHTAADALRLRTAALRERNRLLDTLNAATAAIDEALATLRALGFG
jgi:hypothetical protein